MTDVEKATVTLELTHADRRLISAHGYPFPQLEAALAEVAGTEDLVAIECDRFEVEHLLGDLARSINDSEDEGLALRLNQLYEEIEAAI